MEPVTAADVRAALEVLSSLDPSTQFVDANNEVSTIGDALHGRSVDEMMAEWEEVGDQDEARQIVALADELRPESKMPWGWILFGTAAALGGTWLAVRLIRNGS